MNYASGFMIVSYYVFFLLYFRKLFSPRHPGLLPIMVIASVNIGIYFLRVTGVIAAATIPIMIALMIVGLRFSTSMDWQQAAHSGTMTVLYISCMSVIVAVCGTFIFKNQIVWTTDQLMNVTIPTSLVFFLLLRRFLIKDKNHKRFLQSIKSFSPTIILELFAAVNLLVIYLGSIALSSIWALTIVFTAAVFTIALLVYIVLYSAKSDELFEIKLNEKILEEQIDRQLNHYVFYKEHNEKFRTFTHDYNSLMQLLESLIQSYENEKAIQLLHEIHKDVQNKVSIDRKFSGNFILDAILHDMAGICEKNAIRYIFNLDSPLNTGLSQLNRIRILTNVANNAIEACLRTPVPYRFLEMSSQSTDQWVTLEVSNSFTGSIILKNGIPLSIKKDRVIHGLGLKSVHEIAKEMGGFVAYDINEEKHVFRIRIHIPRTELSTPL